MTRATDRVIAALETRGCRPRRGGSGWSARCPAHDDRRASLSVGEGDDGRALIHCHARCTPEAVCNALGLTLADLMPADSLPMPRRSEPSTRRNQDGRAYATLDKAIEAAYGRLGAPDCTWTYDDAAGEPVGAVVRWDADGRKTLRPLRRDADGWRPGAMREPRPLYGLPHLGDTERVFVVEGEKCADVMRSLGLTATTSAGGSSAAEKTEWSPLAGRHVVVLPDADAPGDRYAQDIARLCHAAGAASVRIVRLADYDPGLPPGGDVDDWVERRASAGDETLRAELMALADAAPEWQPPAESDTRPVVRCVATIEPEPIEWLWPGRIPLGRLALLVGRPGEGKSFLATAMAAHVSCGREWPDGAPCPRGSVLIASAEDAPADTIRPRLDAHGADVSRIHVLDGVRTDDGERLLTLRDVDAIAEALRALGDCRLLVIDPIGAYIGGRTDAHRDNEVRAVLAPIARLAEEYGVAVLVVAHRRKTAAAYADEAALGSVAFVGAARAVWHLARDPDDVARRLLLPGKCNLASTPSGLAFRVCGEPPRIVWDAEAVEMTADDVLAAEQATRRGGRPAEQHDAAAEWLRQALADGPRPAADIMAGWTDGHGGSKRTLDRAKRSVGVVAYQPRVPGPWWWRLADAAPQTAKTA